MVYKEEIQSQRGDKPFLVSNSEFMGASEVWIRIRKQG